MSESTPPPIDDGLDELFGAGEGQARPRTRLIVGLLVSGLTLALLGMVCTAAPGGILVLVAWAVLEKELGRVESGYLPTEFKKPLTRLQTATSLSVLAVVVLFVLQLWLLCGGFYDVLWAGIIRTLGSMLG